MTFATTNRYPTGIATCTLHRPLPPIGCHDPDEAGEDGLLAAQGWRDARLRLQVQFAGDPVLFYVRVVKCGRGGVGVDFPQTYHPDPQRVQAIISEVLHDTITLR